MNRPAVTPATIGAAAGLARGGVAVSAAMLLRIEAPGFVAGVVVGQRAAPIVRYMARWSAIDVADYCRRRGWRCERITGEE